MDRATPEFWWEIDRIEHVTIRCSQYPNPIKVFTIRGPVDDTIAQANKMLAKLTAGLIDWRELAKQAERERLLGRARAGRGIEIRKARSQFVPLDTAATWRGVT
jgi:hypothetical protein